MKLSREEKFESWCHMADNMNEDDESRLALFELVLLSIIPLSAMSEEVGKDMKKAANLFGLREKIITYSYQMICVPHKKKPDNFEELYKNLFDLMESLDEQLNFTDLSKADA